MRLVSSCGLPLALCLTLSLIWASLAAGKSPSGMDEVEALLPKIETLNAQGRWAEAIPEAERVLALVARDKGDTHPATAAALNILGGLYRSFGEYDRALPLLQRAVEIKRRKEGAQSPNTATSLGLLAATLNALGRYGDAEPLARQALDIRRAAAASSEEVQALIPTSLDTLADALLGLGRRQDALPLLLESLERRQAMGVSPGLPLTLNRLARLFLELGQLPGGLQAAQTSLSVGRELLGPDHPAMAEAWQLQGLLLAASGQSQAAFESMVSAQAVHEEGIDRMKGFTSEKQKLRYVEEVNRDLAACLALAAGPLRQSGAVRARALDLVLQRKGLVLEVQRQFQQALTAGDPQALALFAELSALRSQASRLAFSGEEEQNVRARLQQLQTARESLEQRLSRQSQAYARTVSLRGATAAAVAAALPAGSALVELFQSAVRPPTAPKNAPTNAPGEARMLAFVLRAGAAEPALVDLGPAAAIDAAVTALAQAMDRTSQGQLVETESLLRRLHELVLTPLAASLAGAQRLYLSPDGSLLCVPFEVFRGPDRQYLVQRCTLSYLASGRDLLAPPARGSLPGGAGGPASALLLGDPDFDLAAASPAKARKDRAAPAAFPLRGAQGLRFGPLPETRTEVEELARIFGPQARVLLGAQASADALRQAPLPRFLHLATHGFFLDAGRRDLADTPLLRSGLALAGANTAAAQGGNGIVTAEEVLTLNLRGVELVTLSACQTGAGRVRAGEGVFGLRRAIAQAGAGSLVMSLWSVPDQETRELMVSFYSNVLRDSTGKGPDKAQALRTAMLEQQERSRKRRGADSPFFWGAFIYQGL